MSRRYDDRGQVTIWILAFSVVVLLLGLGVTTETWRVVTTWRSVASSADAAASAGASGINEALYRSTAGDVVELDPIRAEDLAYQNLTAQTDDVQITSATATATTDQITVVIHAELDLLVTDALRDQPFEFTATATAEPRPSLLTP